MYLGRIVEAGAAEDVLVRPQHPYTRALLASVPGVRAAGSGRRAEKIAEPASALSPPTGCTYHPRCPYAIDRCSSATPPLRRLEGERDVACDLVAELPPAEVQLTARAAPHEGEAGDQPPSRNR